MNLFVDFMPAHLRISRNFKKFTCMKISKPQSPDFGRKFYEARIARELAAKENEEAQAAYYRKQTEILAKKPKLFSRIANYIGKSSLLGIVLSYMIGMSVLEKWSKVGKVQSENTRLQVAYNQVCNEKQNLLDENTRLKAQSFVSAGSLPFNAQGGILSANGIATLNLSNSSVLTISSASEEQIFRSSSSILPTGKITINGRSLNPTALTVNPITGSQSLPLFRSQ